MNDADFTPTTICSSCWYEGNRLVYNINGRCDVCGGLDFIEVGPILDETKEIPMDFAYAETYRDDPEPVLFGAGEDNPNNRSARDLAVAAAEKLRQKKHINPFKRNEFWK